MLKGGLSLLNTYSSLKCENGFTGYYLFPGLEVSLDYYIYAKKRSALFANATLGSYLYSPGGVVIWPYVSAGIGYNYLLSRSISLDASINLSTGARSTGNAIFSIGISKYLTIPEK
jgi:hypothetical protein